MNPYGESINGNDNGWWAALREALRRCRCGRQKEYAHDEECLECAAATLDAILDESDAELKDDAD